MLADGPQTTCTQTHSHSCSRVLMRSLYAKKRARKTTFLSHLSWGRKAPGAKWVLEAVRKSPALLWPGTNPTPANSHGSRFPINCWQTIGANSNQPWEDLLKFPLVETSYKRAIPLIHTLGHTPLTSLSHQMPIFKTASVISHSWHVWREENHYAWGMRVYCPSACSTEIEDKTGCTDPPHAHQPRRL